MTLTDTKIKNAKPQEKSYRLYDEKGLYLEVFPNGSKLWRWKYRVDGREKRAALGPYSEVSLSEARDEVAKKRAILRQGNDPAIKTRHEIFSFGQIADDWLRVKGAVWVPGHQKRVAQRIKKYLRPALEDRPITDISPKDILPILRAIEAQGTIETAYRVLETCSTVFRYAVACGYIDSDPCRDLNGALTPAKSTPFAAITTAKEAGALMCAIDGYVGDFTTKSAMLFSALTFCRPGEIRTAEWKEIDFEEKIWTLPAEKTKMRKIHLVPLAKQTIELLQNLQLLTGNGRYLFPSPRSAERPISEVTVLAALRRMGYAKGEMTAHGFRSMASTLLNEKGCNFDVIEAQLAHEGYDKVRAVYNRAQYMAERRQLMQDWADYLDQLRTEHLSRSRPA